MSLANDPSNFEQKRLPRQPRQISRFMAQEMLFDYIRGALDADRKAAMDLYIKENAEMRAELESLQRAEAYVAQLAQTRISPESLNYFSQIQPLSVKVAQKMKWQNWPELLRWSTEALLASSLVAIIALMIPWQKLGVNWMQSETPVTLAKVSESPALEDVKLPEVKAAPTPAPAPVPAPAPAAPVAPVATKPVSAAADEEMQSAGVAPTAAAALAATNPNQKVIPLKGLLYRLIMTSDSANSVSADLVEKLKTMGAEKAGQVELGWRKKNPDGNYFHFSMPESNYNQLITTLGEYGPVRIYKSPHERVMPEGQIRIILWIEDQSPQQTQGP